MTCSMRLRPLVDDEIGADVLGDGSAKDRGDRAVVEQLLAQNRALRQEIDRLSVYRQLAYRDDLTGLYNRRYFTERLAQEWSRACRYDAPLSLLLMDLDSFKQINDTAGHHGGDCVLVFVGRHMTAECRQYDIPCRIGGDELAYILPESDPEGARAIVERLGERLARAADRPVLPSGLQVRMSFGIAERSESKSPAELVSRADAAMYAHKRLRKSTAAGAAAIRAA